MNSNNYLTAGYNEKIYSILNNSRSTSICPQTKVNMILKNKVYYISIETPGVKRENLSLEISGRLLIVKGKYDHIEYNENVTTLLSERLRKDINRSIYMPFNADLNRIQIARYKDGVIHIQIPEINRCENDRIIPITY